MCRASSSSATWRSSNCRAPTSPAKTWSCIATNATKWSSSRCARADREAAAKSNTAATSASGRDGGEDLTVDLSIRSARELADTLRDVQDRVRRALAKHALPSARVDVTLVGFDRQHRRELKY